METSPLLKKLELAVRKSLELVDKEREKQAHGAYFSLNTRHPRVVARETFYQHEHQTLLGVMEQVEVFTEEEIEEDKEDVIFVARKLIAEIDYPWIRRRALDQGRYREIYEDKDFELYARDLPHKQKPLLSSRLDILGLSPKLEKELGDELRHKVPGNLRGGYSPSVLDVVDHKHDLRICLKITGQRKRVLSIFVSTNLVLERR